MIDTPQKQTETPETGTQTSSGTRAWWIVGGSITGAFLLFGLTLCAAWVWVASSPEQDASHSAEYTQQVDGVDVTVEVGDIKLAAGDAALMVERNTYWRGTAPEISEAWHGSVFNAEGGCEDGYVSWIDLDDCLIHYALALPSGTDAEAEIDLGNIELDGLDGEIDVSTDVGDVRGEDLRAGETEVETGVGNVDLAYAEVHGDITVEVGTGDVTIVVPNDGTTYKVDFDGGVGTPAVDIATDPSAEADYIIKVTIGVGDLKVRYAD